MFYKLICDLPRVQDWDLQELVDDILDGDNDQDLYEVKRLLHFIDYLDEYKEDIREALEQRQKEIAEEEGNEDEE